LKTRLARSGRVRDVKKKVYLTMGEQGRKVQFGGKIQTKAEHPFVGGREGIVNWERRECFK